MKKYLKELLILFLQIASFYIIPLFAGPTDAGGMVILMLLVTFVLSIIMGYISNKKIKYLYPIIISIIFLPSVFIYYNESALVHALWYLINSFIGIVCGSLIKLLSK